MRRFALERHEDATGVSGVGIVAEGVEFFDGTVAMRWRTDIRSTVFYDEIHHVRHIHGHDGRTLVRWLDP